MNEQISPISPSQRVPFASCHMESCLCHLTLQGRTKWVLEWTNLSVSTFSPLREYFLWGLKTLCFCTKVFLFKCHQVNRGQQWFHVQCWKVKDEHRIRILLLHFYNSLIVSTQMQMETFRFQLLKTVNI